jgi:hypothetical protein
MNQESKSYIYTNWRGKQFIIDEEFARNLREYLLGPDPPGFENEDNVQLKPEDVTYLTPEYLIEVLPDMERWDRHWQLEEMWEKSAS